MGLHGINEMPGDIELSNLASKVDHGNVGIWVGKEIGEIGGPIKEGEGLGEGDAVAESTTSMNDMADEGRRDGTGVMAGKGDGQSRVWGNSAVGVWIRIIAVMIFN